MVKTQLKHSDIASVYFFGLQFHSRLKIGKVAISRKIVEQFSIMGVFKGKTVTYFIEKPYAVNEVVNEAAKK